MKIDTWLKSIYICYLGNDKGRRLVEIVRFMRYHGGEFFERYSTEADSIRAFLKEVKKRGFKL